MQELFANNAFTTLGSALAAGATTCTVSTGTGILFPNPGAGQFFRATLFAAGSTTNTPNEIVLVTARSGDTMTIQRAQEGTVAQSWAVGANFNNELTAGVVQNFAQQQDIQNQANNYGVDTGTANAGVITLGIAPANLAALVGVPIRVKKVNAVNTGAYTLNVNGLGAVPVRLAYNATFGVISLSGGELPAGCDFSIVYDSAGANFQLQSAPAVAQPNSITNAMLAVAAAFTLSGNLTGAVANKQDFPLFSVMATMGYGSSNLSPTGHITFPVLVGTPVQMILNWGLYNCAAPASSQTTVLFDLAFPNQFLFPMISVQGAATDMLGYSNPTQSSMIISKGNADGITPRSGYYFALGY